jgi:hypothetical protein
MKYQNDAKLNVILFTLTFSFILKQSLYCSETNDPWKGKDY